MHTFEQNFNLGKNKTKPHAASDQEQDPATEHTSVNYPRKREGLEESTAHCTTAEGERPQDSEDLINLILNLYSDMPCLLPSSHPLSAQNLLFAPNCLSVWPRPLTLILKLITKHTVADSEAKSELPLLLGS